MSSAHPAGALAALRDAARAVRLVTGGPVEPSRALVLVLTSACNLRCRYCSQVRGGTARMSEAALERSLDVLLADPGRRPRVEFYGGEPLLAFDLVRRAVAYLEARRPADVEPELSLTTNGVLLTAEIAAFLERHRIATQLSFDGVAAAQDARTPDSFAILDALLRRLRRQRATFFHELLSVRLTLTLENLPFLSSSIRYLLARRVARITVAPLVTPEPGWCARTRARLAGQVGGVFRASLAYFRETGTIPVDFVRPRPASPPPAGENAPSCGFGRRDLLVVDTDGAVLPCAGAVGLRGSEREGAAARFLGPLCSGTVFDPDLGETLEAREARLRASEVLMRRASKRSNLADCASCQAISECRACPLATAFLPGNTDPHRVADQACAFTLACWAARRRFAAAFAGADGPRRAAADARPADPPRPT